MGVAGDSGDKGESAITLAQTPDVQVIGTLRVLLVLQGSSPSVSLWICHQMVAKHLHALCKCPCALS